MEGTFDVKRNGRTVGTAEVKREGLYYRIFCRCRVAGEGIQRLYAGGEKIGVLIPESGELTLNTKVAAKRLNEGCDFTIGENTGCFYPICPGEPFEHLDKLRAGRLSWRDGQAGLLTQ